MTKSALATEILTKGCQCSFDDLNTAAHPESIVLLDAFESEIRKEYTDLIQDAIDQLEMFEKNARQTGDADLLSVLASLRAKI